MPQDLLPEAFLHLSYVFISNPRTQRTESALVFVLGPISKDPWFNCPLEYLAPSGVLDHTTLGLQLLL